MHDSCVVAAHAGGAVSRLWQVPGSASALFVDGDAQLLHPEDQVFEAMLAGWRDQQLARNLNSSTIHNRDADVRRFQRFTNDYPWLWRPQDVEEFSAEMRGGSRPAALSTVRGFQGSLRLFLEYAADPGTCGPRSARSSSAPIPRRSASSGT